VFKAITPDDLPPPDDEVTTAAAVAPTLKGRGLALRYGCRVPSLAGSWIKIDDKRLSTSVRACDEHGSGLAATNERCVARFFKQGLTFIAILSFAAQANLSRRLSQNP